MPLLNTCMYGSRLETTNNGLFCSLLLRLTRKRSAVHSDTPDSRSRASLSALARASFRSRAKMRHLFVDLLEDSALSRPWAAR